MRKEKIRKEIKKYVLANYSKINIEEDMIVGETPHNYKCHINVVQQARKNKKRTIY